MGYNEDCAAFDRRLLATFGGGRARPEWAERIGKKYQWIALYRLLARLADHATKKRYASDPPPPTTPDLQASSKRNIDPTLLLKQDMVTEGTSWWAPVGYGFGAGGAVDDDQWLDLADIPDFSQMLVQRDPATGKEWVVLELYHDWSSRGDDEDHYPYRSIWMHIRSYLVNQSDAKLCWEWIKQQRFMGRWMPEGFELHGIHVGEYPNRLTARQFFEEAQSWTRGERPVPFDLPPTVNDLSSDHSLDAYQRSSKSMLVPSEIFFTQRVAMGWRQQLCRPRRPSVLSLPCGNRGRPPSPVGRQAVSARLPQREQACLSVDGTRRETDRSWRSPPLLGWLT